MATAKLKYNSSTYNFFHFLIPLFLLKSQEYKIGNLEKYY